MSVETDPNPAFAEYAHPERLVSTQWLSAHLGAKGLKIVESDEEVQRSVTCIIPSAQEI